MIYVLLADGFEEIEALAFVDILRRAGIETQTVSVQNSKTVTGAHGITVLPDLPLKKLDSKKLDAVMLPGGMPGAQHLKDSEEVAALLRYAHQQEKLIGAICAAPMVLGALGLLDGRQAVCFPGYESELTGATVCSDPVVEDGNIITSKGPGTTAEFASAFVRRFCDVATADTIISSMQYEKR